MRRINHLLHFLRILLFGLLLGSCGGGGETTLATNGGSGLGGTGITAVGNITGFGSIFVNGIKFETDTSTITLDDNPSTSDQLKLGMVVTVSGTVNGNGTNGTATSVVFDDDVQGPVSNIINNPNGRSKTLNVLGLSVIADSTSTVFSNTSFATLAVNDTVEVSGFPTANGAVQATRIEKKANFVPGSTEIELKGTARNVSANSFTLGTFTVNYASADLSRVPNNTISNGLLVEVKGTLSGNTIIASRIKQDDDLLGDNVSKVSLEGLITNFVSNSNFRVLGQQVNASGATLQPATLVLGNNVEVEVEGAIVNGILQATRVEIRGGSTRIEGRVAFIDVSANTVTLQFAQGNLTIQLDSQTSLRDDLDDISPFSLPDISSGDFLEIRGYIDGTGAVTASEIRRDDPDEDSLQGPVSRCAGSTITILGVNFTLVDGSTIYRNQNGGSISGSTAFCNAIGSSFYVKITDDNRDGIADEAELETP
ncbi:MAG: DUF5666 domain-containing protein [Thiolinea sp.]